MLLKWRNKHKRTRFRLGLSSTRRLKFAEGIFVVSSICSTTKARFLSDLLRRAETEPEETKDVDHNSLKEKKVGRRKAKEKRSYEMHNISVLLCVSKS